MARHRPNGFQSGNANGHSKPDDLESAISSGRKGDRFRDVAQLAMTNDYHTQMKRKLTDDVQRGSLEKYRKSADEIKGMKNKKVRQFYEAQNEKLNDWMEVDTVVMSIADDVLDSMNPEDLDGDGVAERRGALHDAGERIHEFLPEDEREKRRKAERNAKWAINVSPIPQGKMTRMLTLPDQRRCQRYPTRCQMRRCWLLTVSIADRLAC